jgi:NTP pyrophosphatase (non-canonical NTP hydrolase)
MGDLTWNQKGPKMPLYELQNFKQQKPTIMNLAQYKEESGRTFLNREVGIDPKTTDLLHCAIGIGTESGELLDQFKRHIYYGKPLDIVNVKEEIGDKMWYIMNLCRLLDLSLEEIMQMNIDKLKTRYPEKFTAENAINRDTDAERKVLEGDGTK